MICSPATPPSLSTVSEPTRQGSVGGGASGNGVCGNATQPVSRLRRDSLLQAALSLPSRFVGGTEGIEGIASLNAALEAWALSKERRAAVCIPGRRSDADVQISNRGAYQSYHDAFRSVGAEAAGCHALQLIVSGAMDLLTARGCVTCQRTQWEEGYGGVEGEEEREWQRGEVYMMDAWCI
uniref:Uncharacterized protein n=1 Tax=Haptolina brevifila TaxID=156173 RepID=A0A7S2IZM4_9EUKA|mmetsp:Transcript_74304/g.147643  ORF Transcript_74304/g.147643 Transcript_74304/m.147643 type:complete len:181 (+) Transcript_74304:63-605(+)